MSQHLISYAALSVAIITETIATSFLKKSEQFTLFWPSLACALGYALSFYMLSIALKTIPVGIAYAIWSAVGIVLIALVGKYIFQQHLDLAAWVGISFIIIGVFILQVFAKTTTN